MRGLSTELRDVSEVAQRQLRLERVVLVGVWTEGDAAAAEASLHELARLAATAGSEVLEGLTQRRSRPDPATYIGAGKARELAEVVASSGADTVICDGELSPAQLRSLEEVTGVKVVDRTALILDIFAQHASSREGKVQVELAQMQYLLPRLRGWGTSLSRQAGGRVAGGAGIGGRGPGETRLETDRRAVARRITRLRRELREMEHTREVKRARRRQNEVPAVAIVGYTNAGKSSLLNALTGAGVLADNQLFATLDPTVRRVSLPGGREATIADTVGFVRHLPHQLVEAFRSSLEEVSSADLILHVVDGADPDPEGQLRAVREVLSEISARSIAELVVVNKCDVADREVLDRLERGEIGSVEVSARTGAGLGRLLEEIEAALGAGEVELDLVLPHSAGDVLARLHREGHVLSEEAGEDGTHVRALVDSRLAGAVRPYSSRE